MFNNFSIIESYVKEQLNVSRETLSDLQKKLEKYNELLLLWQKKINLVAPSTLTSSYSRHFLDSLQIIPYIHNYDEIIDLGSGAGFPALPCACVLPQTKFFLIESDMRKSIFMQEVKRELNLSNVEIINKDILQTQHFLEGKNCCFTTRALSSISQIITFVNFVALNNNLKTCNFVVHKGKDFNKEIFNAKLPLDSYILHDSVTSRESKIIEVKYGKNNISS